MKLHEFQGKELLRSYGVTVPESLVGHFPNEVWKLSMITGVPCVLKAQVLTGGRGKAGGIQICHTHEEVRQTAKELFGKTLSTEQGGIFPVRRILVESLVNWQDEFYFSISMDRSLCIPVVMVSRSGGMEIEGIINKNPEKLMRLPINPYTGIMQCHIRQLGSFLGLNYLEDKLISLFRTLYKVFTDKECTLLEINPLVLTEGNDLVPLDIKMVIDDNSLFRQRDLLRIRDIAEWDDNEAEARLSGMSFVKLDGSIGCMVNGAGLAMATMDFIQNTGSEPANFLDIGGSSTSDTIRKGFEILLKDRQITGIFINIFGGIIQCDRVARGIVSALQHKSASIPVLIRLSGANVREARDILSSIDFAFTVVESMEQARIELTNWNTPKES